MTESINIYIKKLIVKVLGVKQKAVQLLSVLWCLQIELFLSSAQLSSETLIVCKSALLSVTETFYQIVKLKGTGKAPMSWFVLTYRRTTEILQRTHIFMASHCLKVHNAPLKLASPISG